MNKTGWQLFITITVNAVAATAAFLGLPKLAFSMIAITSIMWFWPNYKISSSHAIKK